MNNVQISQKWLFTIIIAMIVLRFIATLLLQCGIVGYMPCFSMFTFIFSLSLAFAKPKLAPVILAAYILVWILSIIFFCIKKTRIIACIPSLAVLVLLFGFYGDGTLTKRKQTEQKAKTTNEWPPHYTKHNKS